MYKKVEVFFVKHLCSCVKVDENCQSSSLVSFFRVRLLCLLIKKKRNMGQSWERGFLV